MTPRLVSCDVTELSKGPRVSNLSFRQNCVTWSCLELSLRYSSAARGAYGGMGIVWREEGRYKEKMKEERI